MDSSAPDGAVSDGACERYNELYVKCPHAGFNSDLQMNSFYVGLNATPKSQVNASAGGSLLSKSAREAFELYDMMASESQQWTEEKFLNKFFPSSKTLALKKKILAFAQKPNESFHEAWERYNELYVKCPHVGFDSDLQMNSFYVGLNATPKSQVNASAGESLLSKSAREAFELYDMMA